MKRPSAILLTISCFLSSPPPVSAHAFGALYNLPIPFWMYLFGASSALLVSFLIIGYFLTKNDKETSYPTTKMPFTHFLTNTWLIRFIKPFSIFLFFLTILTGLFGDDNSYFNFNMTFFWIVFVLGFTYLTGLLGNVWTIINPWKILAETFEFIGKREIKGILNYPEKAACYPALIFYFIFIFTELFGRTTPFSLSLLLLNYTFLTFFGMFLFGKTTWLAHGEFFSVFFRFISHSSLFDYKKNTLYLRPPFSGLQEEHTKDFSQLIFIVFMLSSTAYDGIRETPAFLAFYWEKFSLIPYQLFQTLAMLASPFIFLAIYYTLIFLTKRITKSKLSVKTLALTFAPSLIPIALVYNIAHYYTLLLTQGQALLALISNPFGWNWNLFNTANFVPNLEIIDANTTWHTQVAVIVLGHIAGVYLAHFFALRLFKTRKQALLSQIPMLILMMLYTMIGLWILSQPITSGT